MKTLFWRAYYRFRFKGEYAARIRHAAALVDGLNESSLGRLNHFYNANGEQIRGWHRKRPGFSRSAEHPIVTYYKNR
jgi:hypothetical protein